MKLAAAPKLQTIPDLGPHEIVASQLATNGMGTDGEPNLYQSDRIGRTVAVRHHGAIVAGTLRTVTDSLTYPLIILEIGYFKVAIHPTHPVTVAPEGYRLAVTAKPLEVEQQ
ncbi:hypothetical protein [Rhodococcus sp. BH5]|uniref:hypothetical protein n=1 Tax=Rhodococcus sp. BH5 TaxID=2871702 RepID=UPI0022CDB937|nr:hypothetical protein [Rhodococcus sp. BH5]MCZ9635138.1 hypothetical protein [Rhodococcus sp. BH5]